MGLTFKHRVLCFKASCYVVCFAYSIKIMHGPALFFKLDLPAIGVGQERFFSQPESHKQIISLVQNRFIGG